MKKLSERKKIMDKNNNSGDCNSGYRNSGDYNSGDCNSGDYNSGDYNSGYRNSGYRNSGDYNSGDYNSGYRNSGDYNSGSFNTNEPKMRLFNKELNITVSEFYQKYNIYMDIILNKWINSDNMTEQEKKDIEGWNEMGGYLKTLEYKEACQIWWKESPEEHKRFLELPGFDAKIFEEITGINIESLNCGDVIEICKNGKKFKAKIC